MKTDVHANWTQLHRLVNNVLSESLAPKYANLLHGLRDDRDSHEGRLLGMYAAPASKDRHHDFQGGLVHHLLEMWKLYEWHRTAFKDMHMDLTKIDPSSVLRAIIHHDLNKVWRYKLIPHETEWLVDYADDHVTKLLGSTHKSLHLLMMYHIPLDVVLHNALITAEGGYTKNPPQEMTAFAKLLYFLDDMSANVVSRLHQGRFLDSKRGGMDAIP